MSKKEKLIIFNNSEVLSLSDVHPSGERTSDNESKYRTVLPVVPY